MSDPTNHVLFPVTIETHRACDFVSCPIFIPCLFYHQFHVQRSDKAVILLIWLEKQINESTHLVSLSFVFFLFALFCFVLVFVFVVFCVNRGFSCVAIWMHLLKSNQYFIEQRSGLSRAVWVCVLWRPGLVFPNYCSFASKYMNATRYEYYMFLDAKGLFKSQLTITLIPNLSCPKTYVMFAFILVFFLI